MSDENNFEIKIGTTYDGAGAQAARADLEKTDAAAVTSPTGTSKVNYEAIKAQRIEAERATAVAATETLAIETQKTIEQEKQLIVATRRAMLEATIQGDVTGLAQLRSELAVRQLTVQTLNTEVMTQAQLNAFVAEQNILIQQGAAAVAARAAAEEAEAVAAAGQHRLRGEKGRFGNLAETFGAGSNTGVAIGLGAMLGMEAMHLIQEATKELEKQTAEREKESRELREQIKSHHEKLNAARSMTDVLAVTAAIESEIYALAQKRSQANAEEKASIDERLFLLNNELRIAATWPTANLDRRTAEELLKVELEKQAQALKEQVAQYAEIRRENEDRLKFENELGAAVLKNELLKIKVKEDAGEVSHEEAARQRWALTATEEERRFKREQNTLAEGITNAKRFADEAAAKKTESAERVKALEAERDAKAAEVHAADAAQAKADQAKNAATAAQEKLQKEQMAAAQLGAAGINEAGFGNYTTFPIDPALEKEAKAKEEASKNAAASVPGIQDREKLREEAAALAKKLSAAKEADKQIQAEAQRELDARSKEIKMLETKRQQKETLKTHTDTAREIEGKQSVGQGAEQDAETRRRKEEAARRAEEQARKEREKFAAPRAELAKEGVAIADATIARYGKSVMGLEKQAVGLAQQAKQHPDDLAVIEKLHSVLELLAKVADAMSGSKEFANQKAHALAGVEKRLQNLEQQIKGVSRP